MEYNSHTSNTCWIIINKTRRWVEPVMLDTKEEAEELARKRIHPDEFITVEIDRP